jgi:hypothetical protein
MTDPIFPADKSKDLMKYSMVHCLDICKILHLNWLA